nr:hypothetical protein [Tanacetum cinerariifolium]
MLEKSIYDSWASRIRLFIKGKNHGRMMLDSIDNGPLVYPTIEEDGQNRPKKYSELTEVQQLQDDCDVQATNIIFYSLPPNVYALFNHQEAAKDIWNRVKLLMKGSGDHNLKDDCPGKTNKISNFLNEEVFDQSAIPSESNVHAIMLSKQISPGQSFENLIHGGDDIKNVDYDDESENEGNHCAFEDVVQPYPNHCEFTSFTEQVRLLTNQVTTLVNEQ